ncbi:MAG: ABC transporter substrate-binding protein [Thermodesulfovibrionales bacterium]
MLRSIFALIAVFISVLHPIISEGHDVAVIKSADIKPYNDALSGFKSSCGCSITEIPYQESDPAALPKSIAQLHPDAVLAIGMDAFQGAQSIKDIPVVFTMVPHLPSSVTGRQNIYGVSMTVSPEKQLDTILQLVPTAKRIGIIYDPQNAESFVREASQSALAKGIILIPKKASKPGDVPSLIESMQDKIDVFWMLPDTTVINAETVNSLLLFSFQNKIPIFAFATKYVEMGALAALNIDPVDLGVQAGEIMKRLLDQKKGGIAAPVAPRKTVLTINRKIARKLGIDISKTILEKAYVVQ